MGPIGVPLAAIPFGGAMGNLLGQCKEGRVDCYKLVLAGGRLLTNGNNANLVKLLEIQMTSSESSWNSKVITQLAHHAADPQEGPWAK